MKYKIIKRQEKTLFVCKPYNSSQKINISTREWYEARRKGRIFGFWHKVGHNSGYEGELISHITDTLEEMEDYIAKWHEVNYGDKYKYKIIKKFDL